MSKTEYQLVPGIGVLPIRFGMSEVDVATAFGPAEFVTTNFRDEKEEVRGPVTIQYSRVDNKVADVGLLPSVPLFFEGVNLFRHNDPIEFLSQYDVPFETVGFVVFPKLGLTLTGFHDCDESQKAIAVFRPGRWEEIRGN